MEAKEYVKKLEYLRGRVKEPEKTYWEINHGMITRIRINETPINANNVYIVFRCTKCNGDDDLGYHVIHYKDLKKDKDGDLRACCPKSGRSGYNTGTCVDCIPPKLQPMFELAEFEPYEDFDE